MNLSTNRSKGTRLGTTKNKGHELAHTHLPLTLPAAQCKVSVRKPPTPHCSLRRERAGTCVQCFSFSRSYPKDWFLYYLFQNTEIWHGLDAWGLLKIKRSGTACCCSRGPAVQQTGTGGSKRLQAPIKRFCPNFTEFYISAHYLFSYFIQDPTLYLAALSSFSCMQQILIILFSLLFCHACFLIFLDVGLPCGSDGKESVCKAGDLCLIPGSGRSPGEGNGYYPF